MTYDVTQNPFHSRIEQARQELNATKWWQWGKRNAAADTFKFWLLQGAYWELDNEVHQGRNRIPGRTDSDEPAGAAEQTG